MRDPILGTISQCGKLNLGRKREQMPKSEVAQLREKIENEIQAMRFGLTGYAITSKHAIIDNKYSQLGDYQQQLEQHIGATAAIEVVIDALNQLGHDHTTPN